MMRYWQSTAIYFSSNCGSCPNLLRSAEDPSARALRWIAESSHVFGGESAHRPRVRLGESRWIRTFTSLALAQSMREREAEDARVTGVMSAVVAVEGRGDEAPATPRRRRHLVVRTAAPALCRCSHPIGAAPLAPCRCRDSGAGALLLLRPGTQRHRWHPAVVGTCLTTDRRLAARPGGEPGRRDGGCKAAVRLARR
jgi:hypothetical protein